MHDNAGWQNTLCYIFMTHASDLEPSPDLVDNQRGQCLTLNILGNDEQRPLGCHHLLQDGQQGCEAARWHVLSSDALKAYSKTKTLFNFPSYPAIFFSLIRIRGFSSSHFIVFWSVMKYGLMYPRSNFIPSTTSSSFSNVLPSYSKYVPRMF